MVAQSKRWCFTLNNYDDGAVRDLVALAQECQYLVFGRETAASGTPHLQGFVIFQSNHRAAAAKRKINERAHVETARGTSKQASDYCKKEGNFEEFGELPANQGKRTDFEDLKTWVVEHPSKPTAAEIAAEFGHLYIKYGRIMEWVDLIYPSVPLVEGDPTEWQRDLSDSLNDPPDDRTVVFVIDYEGGKGKTWFCKWYCREKMDSVQLLRIGRRDDIALTIKEGKSVFLIDVPRSQSEFLQYSILEQLKDGLVFSPKYESRMKHIGRCHVVVFMNEDPDMNKLSNDRYKLIRLANRPTYLILN